MWGTWAWHVLHHDHEAAHSLVTRELRAGVPEQPTKRLGAGTCGAGSHRSNRLSLSRPNGRWKEMQPLQGCHLPAESPPSRLATPQVPTHRNPPCGPRRVAAPAGPAC